MVQLYTEKTTELNHQVASTSVNTTEKSSMKVVKSSEFAMTLGQSNNPYSSYEGQNNFAEDFLNKLGVTDVAVKRNYMTIMSNTLSGEDYAALVKDGVNPNKTDVAETVNTLDEIKARLAQAGVIIKGYNDNLSSEQLAEITGSEVTANAIERAFRERSIPLSAENATAAAQAFAQASEIEEITDGMCDYLLRNALEPTLDHLYRVRFSGATVPFQGGGYFTDTQGYMAKQSDAMNFVNLEGRIRETIENCGLEVNEETVAESQWLIESGILYNESNLSILDGLRHIKMPMDADRLADSIGNAIVKGRNPKDALLSDTANYYEEAVRINEEVKQINDSAVKIVITQQKTLSLYNLKIASSEQALEDAQATAEESRVQNGQLALEQIRLKMTVECNIKMMKRGISIETTALSELVNTLEALEDEKNRAMFGSLESKESLSIKASLYQETNRQVAELPFLPASAIGRTIQEYGSITISKVYEAGVAMQKMYESAMETYEAVGTEVRADLGDNIKKAFENVDELIAQTGLNADEENRRAVRILGYNRMEITVSNIELVRSEDEKLQNILSQMTPGRVLKLIREGVNPLEESMESLSAKLSQMENASEETVEDYARFLHKLDTKKGITEAERDSYIGIYRLVKLLNRTDGAALGHLIGENAEISFRNLLSALRSEKASGLDIKVDEEFGEIQSGSGYKFDISKQIMAGYAEISKENAEESAAFYQEKIEEMKSSLAAPDKVMEELIHFGEPVTPENMAAMSELLENNSGNSPWKVFGEMEKRRSEDFQGEAKADENMEKPFSKALENFRAAFTDMSSIQDAYKNIMTEASEMLSEAPFKEGVGRIDLKELSLSYRKLNLMGGMMQEENYEIPVELDGVLSGIRLKILHKGTDNGNVVSSFTSETFGTISAQFYFTKGELRGLIAGDSQKGLDMLKNSGTEEAFEAAGIKVSAINYVYSERLNLSNLYTRHDQETEEKVSTRELYSIAKTFIETVERVGRQ